ncbi:unnamed protein product, partial [Citrullus colocynthis]
MAASRTATDKMHFPSSIDASRHCVAVGIPPLQTRKLKQQQSKRKDDVAFPWPMEKEADFTAEDSSSKSSDILFQ